MFDKKDACRFLEDVYNNSIVGVLPHDLEDRFKVFFKSGVLSDEEVLAVKVEYFDILGESGEVALKGMGVSEKTIEEMVNSAISKTSDLVKNYFDIFSYEVEDWRACLEAYCFTVSLNKRSSLVASRSKGVLESFDRLYNSCNEVIDLLGDRKLLAVDLFKGEDTEGITNKITNMKDSIDCLYSKVLDSYIGSLGLLSVATLGISEEGTRLLRENGYGTLDKFSDVVEVIAIISKNPFGLSVSDLRKLRNGLEEYGIATE